MDARGSQVAPNPSSAGFTLVELLVVIGIIAVLVAMLLPAINRSREAAQRAVCLSNLRQVSLSLRQYSIQFKEYFPVGFINGIKQNNYYFYAEGFPVNNLGSYPLFGRLYQAGLAGRIWNGAGAASQFKTDKASQIYFCPSENSEIWKFDGRFNAWPPGSASPTDSTRTSYVLRPTIRGQDVSWGSSFPYNPAFLPKLSQVKPQTALAAEGVLFPFTLPTRHRTGFTVSYGDGSARFVQVDATLRTIVNGLPVPTALSTANNSKCDELWTELDRK